MNSKIFLLFLLLPLLIVGCSCGDDDDDSTGRLDDDTADDDTASDDDVVLDDDVTDDDTTDDDTTDDDTSPDDDTTPDDDTVVDDDTTDDDTTLDCDWDQYNPLMVTGKTALGDYDPAAALTAFEAAADLCPEVGDAQLGVMLAEFQNVTKTLQAVFAQYPDFPFIDWAAFQVDVEEDLLPLNDGLLTAALTVEADFPEARLFVPAMPLFYSGGTLLIDGAGEWDYADALNVGALGGLFDAMELFLLAFDFEADWTLLQTFPYLYDPIEIIHYFSGQILLMFDDPNYPDFMTFTENGPQYFSDFAVALGFAAIDANEGFAAVLLETDPQQDDITGYVDLNGNGQWDEGEPYSVPYFGPFATEMNLFLLNTLALMGDLGPALLDTGPEDLHPIMPDWLPLGDLNYILEALQGWVPGLTLPEIPIPVGMWFYGQQPEDGLRSTLDAVVQWVYDYTAPKKD